MAKTLADITPTASAPQKQSFRQRFERVAGPETRKVVRDVLDLHRSDALEPKQRSISRPTFHAGSARGNRAASAAVARLQLLQTTYQRNAKSRQAELLSLKKKIKKTFFLIVVAAFAVAFIADLLSLIDLGLVVSWLIPGITWFLSRRITIINKGAQEIAKAHNQAARQLAVLRQRLRPILGARVGVGAIAQTIVAQGASYVVTYIRDTTIAQVIELVPFVDMLPIYLAQVAKMVVQQNIAYQKAKKLMPGYERVLAQIDQLEWLEVEHVARIVSAAIAQQVRQATVSQPNTANTEGPTTIPALSYGFAT